jgi:hypothetical protein
MRVRVFVYKFLDDFSPRRGYRKAVEFDLPDSECDHMRVLEHVFEQLNVGGEFVPAEPWCREYRNAGHASLSVDDVVFLGDKGWHCARFGWEPLPEDWEPADDEYRVDAQGRWVLHRPQPAAGGLLGPSRLVG